MVVSTAFAGRKNRIEDGRLIMIQNCSEQFRNDEKAGKRRTRVHEMGQRVAQQDGSALSDRNRVCDTRWVDFEVFYEVTVDFNIAFGTTRHERAYNNENQLSYDDLKTENDNCIRIEWFYCALSNQNYPCNHLIHLRKNNPRMDKNGWTATKWKQTANNTRELIEMN